MASTADGKPDAKPPRVSKKDTEARASMMDQYHCDLFLVMFTIVYYTVLSSTYSSKLDSNPITNHTETNLTIALNKTHIQLSEFNSSFIVAGTSVTIKGLVWYQYGKVVSDFLDGDVETYKQIQRKNKMFSFIKFFVAWFDILMFFLISNLIIYKHLTFLAQLMVFYMVVFHLGYITQWYYHATDMAIYLNKRIDGQDDDPDDYIVLSREELIIRNLQAVGMI